MDRFEIVQRSGERPIDVITTNDRAHAFKRFRELVASGAGTAVTLWDNVSREYLATAEYSAARIQEVL